MGIRDLEAFMRERASVYDSSMDVTIGSPFDVKVIQPLLRRVGIDPFSVDITTFLVSRLKQAYPKMALDEGDNLVDLLIKANSLLWDPIVRETTRVKRNQSFSDPTTLTLDEADSLGGSFFSPRKTGRYARGPVRIYFGTPSDQSVNQNNFITSNGGLVFFPTSLQGIRSVEMNLNTEGSLYYFDINVIAEEPGVAYNIGPNEVSSIANIPGAVRVKNLRKFKFGEDEEDVIAYVNRLQQSLGEKSMVVLRGIAAKLLEGFPEINRLNVVGFNDPEMQRDIVTGGGLGPILASGKLGRSISDGENQTTTRRFITDEVDFGPLIRSGNLVLTVVGATTDGGDYDVLSYVGNDGSDSILDLEEQVLSFGETELRWFLRRRELTLSHIPGGILFPDSPNGTVSIPNDSVHIGGAHDIHVRTSGLEEVTFTLEAISDDEPVLDGVDAEVLVPLATEVYLNDYVLGTDYEDDDSTYQTFAQAAYEGWSLQIQEGSNAGTYRILSVDQATGLPAVVTVTPALTVNEGGLIWRMFDEINIDLVEPKNTKVSASNLSTTQGSNIVKMVPTMDLDDFGVAEDDVLRIISGDAAGDYTITEDPLPGGDRLRVDRELPRSLSSLSYIIFTPGTSSMDTPMVRIRGVELLDSSSQPQGSFIPYACPVDVQSRAFQNPARGVKHDLNDGELGLITQGLTFPLTLTGTTNTFLMEFGTTPATIVLAATTYTTLQDLVDEFNTKILSAAGAKYAEVAVAISTNRVGFRPAGNGYISAYGGNGHITLYGDLEYRTTADIRSEYVENTFGGWSNLDPLVDFSSGLDVIQIVGGRNSGFIAPPFVLGYMVMSSALTVGEDVASIKAGEGTYFSPEINRDVSIGTRSIGSVRVYFLEPTTFEVGEDTVFELDMGESGTARFIPDPTLTYQQIPPLPDGDTPTDGSSADGGSVFTSSTQDFLASNINVGDELVIEYFPIYGSVSGGIPDPIPAIVGKTFIYSVEGEQDRTLTFIRDDTSLAVTEASRDSIASQINASVGESVATIEETSPGEYNLVIRTDVEFIIRKEGTANDIILGERGGMATGTPPEFSDEDQDNVSPHAGTYEIDTVGTSTVGSTTSFPTVADWPSPVTEQTFKVRRTGVQRINTTAMSENEASGDLYYFDVELISEGAGDFWNIEAGQQLTVTGYTSDGYRLVVDDDNLTFSEAERVKMVLSRSILEQGVNDDPRNATQLTGQNLQVTYERSATIENVQDFAQSDVERVVCASPLARHLIPHFIRFNLTYTGGSEESVVIPDVEKYITDLFPMDTLDSSDVQALVTGRGATYVQNPIDFIAVVHRIDRSIWIQRSQDRLSTGRLSSFIPDILNIRRVVEVR